MRSIIRGLIASAESDPEAARVMGGGGEVWTNRMLVHRMFSIATYLRRNVRAGSRVVLQTDSVGLFWSGFAGTCAAGCDVVPASASAPSGVTDRIRVELAPAYWLDDGELRSIVGEASMIEAEDVGGAILLSSGTTGRSRFLRRSSEMLDRIAKVLVASGLHTARDHVIASLPLHHAYGLEHAFLRPRWPMAGSRTHHRSIRASSCRASEVDATFLRPCRLRCAPCSTRDGLRKLGDVSSWRARRCPDLCGDGSRRR